MDLYKSKRLHPKNIPENSSKELKLIVKQRENLKLFRGVL